MPAILNGPSLLGMQRLLRPEKHNFPLLFSKKSAVALKTRPKRQENLGRSIIQASTTRGNCPLCRPFRTAEQMRLLTRIPRINLCEDGRLSNVRLVHDEQLQFDEILEVSKKGAESLRKRAAEMFTPHSNFNFRETASLTFANSTESVGLQVADILAGFCMRCVKGFFTELEQVKPIAHQTYDLLRRFTNPANGVGLNLVMSSNRARALSLFTI
ncbi:MAG: DUF3800 domain-containing protein [Acidiferrobacteraceae bacterium]